MNYNERTVTMKLKRIEVCDLLIALTAVADSSDAEKWDALHDKVEAILDKFDRTISAICSQRKPHWRDNPPTPQ